jgi:hypothetical protein
MAGADATNAGTTEENERIAAKEQAIGYRRRSFCPLRYT